MKISIITVVWNDAKGLKKTINSIIHQEHKNIEFIIIDGNSTDETTNIIKQYNSDIDFWISEEDNGIYDAMNKGIAISTGEWINFMNAGDIFCNNKVLSSINFKKYTKASLLYGNQIKDNKTIIPQPISILEIGGTFACHQAMFFNRTLLASDLIYDTKYPIYADYALVNNMYLKNKKLFKYLNINVTNFEGGGISSKITKQKRIDRYTLLLKHYGLKGILLSLFHNIKMRIK